MDLEEYKYSSVASLSSYPTDTDLGKKSTLKAEVLEASERIAKWQDALFAERKQSLLIVFQGMDAAGKDSAIRAIFSRVNPQGLSVHGFKRPSEEEYAHDFLWRHYLKLPKKGTIGIFNRSHYENVIVTKVHPEYILSENLPQINGVGDIGKDFWSKRYQQINDFERTQTETGTIILKFMLNVSQKEQHKRFLDRIENTEDNWKFSEGDWKESMLWNKYMQAYQEMLDATSTELAPWYVIPCDNKSTARLIMSHIIEKYLQSMNPQYPHIAPSDLDASREIAKIIKKES